MASVSRHVSRPGVGPIRRYTNARNRRSVWHDLFEVAADSIVKREVIAVILYGSLTRDDWMASSDVDLAVVVRDDADPLQMRRMIKNLWADRSISVITPSTFTCASLIREAERHPTFAAHLVDEGIVIIETHAFANLEKVLIAAATADGPVIEKELRERANELYRLTDLRRFNRQFVPMLARLYALARSIVIARLLQQGVSEYSWRQIFDTLATHRPDLALDLQRLRDLRPYYDHAHGRRRLADEDQDIDPEFVKAAIRSIKLLTRTDEDARATAKAPD